VTFEHKIVVGLDDIKAVSFECNQCHTRVTMSPDKIVVPHKCPNPQCDNVWIWGDPKNFQSVTSPHMNFVNAIGQIRKQLEENGGGGFKVLLEFENAPGS
jgi:hypothetical protein